MLNLDEHSPKSLEEAVSLLEHALTDPERDHISREGAEQYHHTAGQAIRNAWVHPRWNQLTTPLTKHFIDRFGWLHADDISGLILEGLTHAVRREPYDPAPSVARYKKHWFASGVNPDTGNEI